MTNGDIVINEVFSKLYAKLKRLDLRNNTVELLNVHLTFDPNEEYLDYSPIRMASRKYIANELKWYLSKDYSIVGHEGIENNKIWQYCAGFKGRVNSNYGAIVYQQIGNKTQFEHAIDKLIKDACTRQSLIIYTRPELHIEYNDDIHAHSDFVCTTHTQHFITNDNKFEYIVNMRSNDAMYGLQNDYSWHRYVYFQMFNELRKYYPDLQVGNIHWNAGSLHVYERHFELLKEICENKEHTL